MKISIEWAFSTGKSTLVKELWKLWYNVVYDLERDLIKELWNPKDMTKEEINLFQNKLIDLQLEKERQKEVIFDWWLYTMLSYMKNNDINEYNKNIQKILKKAKYDKVFLTLNELDIEDDWIRSIDKEYQTKIQTTIAQLIKLNWDNFILLKWNIKQRLNTIIHNLHTYV